MPNNDYLDFLAHHGILGQKWGVRRYQNPDGSLTSAGEKRYSDTDKGNKRLRKNAGAKRKSRMNTDTKIKIVAGINACLALLGVSLMYQNFKRTNAFNTSTNRLNVDMNKVNAHVQSLQEKINAKRDEVLLDIGKRHAAGGNFEIISTQNVIQNSPKIQEALDRINNMLADL